MEGDFYRSVQKKKLLRRLLKKIFKTRRRAFLVIGGLALTMYLLFDNQGVLKRIELEMKKRELAGKIQSAQEETKNLQAQAKALEGDKKVIEKIAREKYGMARDGEKVYRVKKD